MRTTKSRAPGMMAIAERANVSIATVSRTFKHPDQVRPQTIAKVKQAAAQLGYVVGANNDRQRHPSSGTVAVVLPTIENSIFSEMIGALTQTLIELDRTLVVATHNYNFDEEVRIVRSMIQRKVDGIVLIGHQHREAIQNLIQAAQMPLVEAWNFSSNSNSATVGIDNEKAGQMIAELCFNKGHRNFALVFPDRTSNDRAALRHQGALNAIKNLGAFLDPEHDFTCSYDIAHAKDLALTILKNPGPTVYLCANDVIALGFLFAAQSLGLKVPKDISIVGIGDFSFAKSTEPSLTTVRIPAKTIGREIAELITRMIERPVLEDVPSIQIQPKIIERKSCGTRHNTEVHL